MMATLQQLSAVSALIRECESLISSGELRVPQEMSLRFLVAMTLSAFTLPSKTDREFGNVARTIRKDAH